MAWYDEYDKSLGSKFNQDDEDETLVQLADEVEQEQAENENEASPLEGLENILSGSGYIQTLSEDADKAKVAADEAWKTMGGIASKWQAEKQRRADELKPRFTQQEIDERRAKSTALSTLTSALANVANGIAVAKGGLNATVPDGYQAAYEHWNDVQKRHDMRQAEYDKLVDSVWQHKYGMSKAEYDRLQAEAKMKEGYLHNAQMQEQKSKSAKEMKEMEYAYKAGEQKQKHEDKMEEIESSGQWGVKKAATTGYWNNKKQETANAGKKNGGADLEDFRTYHGNHGASGNVSVTIPDGMDVEDGYLAMAGAAVKAIEEQISDLSRRGSDTFIGNPEKRVKEIARLKAKQDKLNYALLGSNKDKATKIKNISTAIANSGISQSAIEAALDINAQNDEEENDLPPYMQ